MTKDNSSTSVVPFSFEGSEVRVIRVGSGLWWVLSDVCAVLDIGSPHKAAERLDGDEKGRTTIPTLGGPQEMAIINESGLWSLVLTSRKTAAKRFKKWITSEVIPSIRATGGYSVAPEPSIPQTLPEALRLAADLAEQKAEAEARLSIAEPKAEAYDRIADSDGTYTVTQAAKTLGVRPSELFAHMRGPGLWLYRKPGCSEDIAYQGRIQSGLMVHRVAIINSGTDKEKTITRARITAKGLAKLSKALLHT